MTQSEPINYCIALNPFKSRVKHLRECIPPSAISLSESPNHPATRTINLPPAYFVSVRIRSLETLYKMLAASWKAAGFRYFNASSSSFRPVSR